MNASEVMDPKPTTLKPEDTIERAAKYIMQKRYRNLPIVDDDGCYIGMFGVNCLLKHVIPKAVFIDHGLENVSFIHESLEELYQRFSNVKDLPISLCMNKEVETVKPDTPLTETLLLLYRSKTSIPVLEEGSCKLLGMVSYWDIGKSIMNREQVDA